MDESVEALVNLGFTNLEAEAYRFLLGESPATGYRVAQALGRPAANVYKTLDSLRSKGAVVTDDGGTLRYRATPADELLDRLDRSFRQRRRRAQQALERLPAPQNDSRVYQLRTYDQVMERFRSMLARTERLALADCFPEPLEDVATDLEATANRGVYVAVKAYQPKHIEGVTVIPEPRGEYILQRWPGAWANLIVDGSEILISMLHRDRSGVHQAIWSESPYLAVILLSSVGSELAHTLTRTLLDQRDETSLRDAIEKATAPLFAPDLPGYIRIMRQLRPETDRSLTNAEVE